MEKARKREIAQIFAKRASDEFIANCGVEAAKRNNTTDTKKTDKKPA